MKKRGGELLTEELQLSCGDDDKTLSAETVGVQESLKW